MLVVKLNAYKRGRSYDLVTGSVSRLEDWLKKHGWKGYDPFDVLGTPFFLKIESLRVKSYLWEKVLTPLVGLPYLLPLLTRRILLVKKTRNPMAAALFARGYLNLYKISEDSDHLRLALDYLGWLEEHYSRGYSGMCWGYPFDWQSNILFPKDTPSGVVTSIVVQAFLGAYEVTKEKRFKEIAVDAINFFLKDLHIMLVDNDKLCFSYTPLDKFRVHNANLWVASTLARMIACAKLKKYKKLILRAVNFTLSDQRTDGGFYYWDTRYAQAKGIRNGIDNYHTGYVIEALADIAKYMGHEQIKDSVIGAFRFYEKNLMKNGSTPKHSFGLNYSGDITDPIILDINDCSEAILVFLKMYSSGFPPKANLSKKIARWTIRNMQDRDGHFYYRIYRWGIDKTSHIRWSQAWMFFALTELLKAVSKHECRSQRNKNLNI